MPLFSHEHLGEAIYSETSPVIQDLTKHDSTKDTDTSNVNKSSNAVANDPTYDIFSPVIDHRPASIAASSHLSPTPPQKGKDNVHVSSPRPQHLPRVIRRTRSEILTRTTNIRPSLHQIIEEDSISDFRYSRYSDASSVPLLRQITPTAPTHEATDKTVQDPATDLRPRDNDEGVRQRKVSGSTTDGQEGEGSDKDKAAGSRDGNELPGVDLALHPRIEQQQQQQQKNKKLEDEIFSLWQWLLGCLRRRST